MFPWGRNNSLVVIRAVSLSLCGAYGVTMRKIIIDTDPGQDDAIAILTALGSPEELDVIGITTVGGNVPLDLTTKNALMMVELAKRTDVPVVAGHQGPKAGDS